MMNFLTKQKWQLVVLLQVCLLTFASCEDDNNFTVDAADYITMNVVSSNMQNGRALIEDDSMLEEECSSAGNKSIGIKSFYEKNGTVINNVLDSDGDVSLIYDKGTTCENNDGWTYGETAAKWVDNATYTFTAYFPMKVVKEVTASETSPFITRFSSEFYQEDFMMAYSQVKSYNSGKAVNLDMLHVLSALQFHLSFSDTENRLEVPHNDSDFLTAFWFENTKIEQGLCTIGELEFGVYDEGGNIDNETGNNIKWNCISRPKPTTDAESHKFYEWEHAEGVEFYSNESEIVRATAYSKGTGMFAQNNGFVLTIPQDYDGSSNFCFCLKSTGEKVYRASLPARKFEPGTRYIYYIRLGKTNVSVDVKILPWNELKSSADITL